VAHAEASARTVDAAVTAAAAQLGLRPDQVDIEVLEDPVPSTFGYIGTPARVRVTPRSQPSPPAPAAADRVEAAGPSTRTAPSGLNRTTDSYGAEPTNISEPSGQESGSVDRSVPGPTPDSITVGASSVAASEPTGSAGTPHATARGAPAAAEHSEGSGDQGDGETPRSGELQGAGQPRAGATDEGSRTTAAPVADHGPIAPATSDTPLAGVSSDAPTPSVGTPEAATVGNTSTMTQPSSEATTGGDLGPESEAAAARVPVASEPGNASLVTTPAEPSTAGRPPRRTYRDEPIEPAMVEADTERAGDFLEGLLDALDVDGDITTWVDEVGGHIDLEGSDLDMLVGSNGETLDALQELTRLAVLRQAKRRVRLLIDINGFRARQREQLISMVKATVERVVSTREDYEFQPMTPAERKIVHDAVAAMDGARTESLGEEPHRRVVIRPT
jgi:spoIIIJ-associated protein